MPGVALIVSASGKSPPGTNGVSAVEIHVSGWWWRRTPVMLVRVFLLLRVTSHAPLAQQAPSQKHLEIAALEQQIAGKEQLPAEQVWKNIQTFKGMPAIRVLRIMEQAFVPNLGVECSYCHFEKQWDSDEKNPKQVARQMWVMRAEWQEEARKASGNRQAVVTCYTCHKGQPKPAFAPGKP